MPIQTSPEGGLFSRGINWLTQGTDHPPPSSNKVKERVNFMLHLLYELQIMFQLFQFYIHV